MQYDMKEKGECVVLVEKSGTTGRTRKTLAKVGGSCENKYYTNCTGGCQHSSPVLG